MSESRKNAEQARLYQRDMVGYADKPPDPQWPGGARLALQFVLNYEEGGENCVLDGDQSSEAFLSEIVMAKAYDGVRHMSMESIYEYGARVGVWRILHLFEQFEVPLTVFAVALALARNPRLSEFLAENEYDICAHGYKWIDYQFVDEQTERSHIAGCQQLLEELTGSAPTGWYTGRNSPNTRRLILEHGGFLYDSDAYDDDLPHWVEGIKGNNHLIIPYTLDVNDMRFATVQGFNTADHFFHYLKDSFDALYLEGQQSPRMMSIGMHARILGRPGRIQAMRRFLEYLVGFDDIWLCSRAEIADHWYQHFAETGNV